MIALIGIAAAGTLSGLVTANGYGAAVFADADGSSVLRGFHDHLYQQADAASDPTWDLLYDTYFGLRADGESGWLDDAGETTVEPGTGIVSVDRSRGALTVTESFVAPMGLTGPGLLHVLHVENTGASTVSDVSVFSLHNWHLGENGASEALVELDGGLLERGTATGFVVHVVPLDPPDVISCDDVWSTVNAGQDLSPGCDREGDDLVGGLQWDLGDMAPGEERWFAVLEGFATDTTSMSTLLDEYRSDRTATELLDAERDDWAAWHSSLPAGLSADEETVALQQAAWLRMAQVREEGDANGQIVASLPYADGDFTHVWNIAWVRDGAYAARALAESGHPDEAAAAIRFLIQDKAGTYADYLDGQDYLVSVCRLYGDGSEWSDDDGTGPNIELDGWGLVLWAMAGAIDAGATDLLADVPRVLDGVADPLVALVDETGLVTEDSSIWERHWNGHQKHFTYTSAWAVRGLRDAADLAEAVGDARADGYRAAADGIAAAMAESLVVDGVLVGNLEEAPGDALDLAAADAFANGALTLDAGPSLEAWEALATAGGGYARNDDGDTYDRQEWLFIDLRLAEADHRLCRPEAGDALIARATTLALDNDGVLPELLDPETAEVEGPAPMIGFGAGVYLLALGSRGEADCQVDTGADTGGDDTGEDDTAPNDTSDTSTDTSGGPGGFHPGATGGCGCGTGAAAGWAWVFVFGGLARRRVYQVSPKST